MSYLQYDIQHQYQTKRSQYNLCKAYFNEQAINKLLMLYPQGEITSRIL